jgi:hypothetical protein
MLAHRISQSKQAQWAVDRAVTLTTAGVSQFCKGGIQLASVALRKSREGAGHAILMFSMGALVDVSTGIGEGLSRGIVILNGEPLTI